MKKVEVSIIIVSFHSEHTIIECIQSVLKTVRKNSYEIIISDNSLDDKTKDTVESFKTRDNIMFIDNGENLGFSRANNIAVKKASGDFILFLNPDTQVYDGAIDGMIDFMKNHPDCGVSTCFVELTNGQLDDSSHRGFPTPWRSFSYFSGLSKMMPSSKFFGGYNLSYLDISKPHEIESAAGSFMLVRRNVGNEIGWWDEDFFFYGEDLDFCYRVKEKGYTIWFVPQYRVLHLKGVSSGIKKVSKDITKANQETKKLATYHRFKAMEIFYDKHYRNKYPDLINFFVKSGIKVKRIFA